MTLVRKSAETQIKMDGEEGRGQAVFATLNVVDKDGDLTVPGAFRPQTVKILAAHDWGAVPIGKATIREQGEQAIADFQMNLKTTAGREWYEALKFDMEHGQPVQEWSYGFTIDDAVRETRDGKNVRILKRLSVHEVSPVVVGAGEGTRTTAIKAIKNHKTGTNDGVWDAVKAVRGHKSGDIGALEGGAFPHHFVDDDGACGDASVRACLSGIALLSGAKGDLPMSEEDRKAAYEHLAGHLSDAGIDAPELPGKPAIKMADQIDLALWELEAVHERVKSIATIRSEKGGKLSEAHILRLKEFCGLISNLGGDIMDTVNEQDAGTKAFLAYQKTLHKINGVL